MPKPAPQATVSPYAGLEDRAFWRAGVVEASSYPPPDIYRPKFPLTKEMPVFTAGSCFAQHIGQSLGASGFNVIDTEPLPAAISLELAQKHGYRLYAARFGNIYTVRQFLQLLQEAFGTFKPADAVWENDGTFYDALRPGVTPGGLTLVDYVREQRTHHLRAVQDAVAQASVVVLTLGLTEAWQHTASGTVYPTAPGTIAGQIDPDVHSFVNFRASEIRHDFLSLREIFQAANKDVKFLLTVSPVPLTATASGAHVLPATMYSKSVLRTVAGELAEDFDDVDYFPSYEIIASHPAGGKPFAADMRSVKPRAIRRTMQTFLQAHGESPDKTKKQLRQERRAARAARIASEADTSADDAVCEDVLLDAFRK